MLKYITALLMTCLTATSALSFETFPMGSYGDWDSSIQVTESGNAYCVASTINDSGSLFDVSMSPNLGVHVFLVLNIPLEDDFVANFRIQTENTYWDLNKLHVTPIIENSVNIGLSHITWEINNPNTIQEFLQKLMTDNELIFVDSDNEHVARWSLKGSTKAFRDVAECVGKIKDPVT